MQAQQQLYNRSYQTTPVPPQQPVPPRQQTSSRPQSGHQQLQALQASNNDGPSNDPGAPGPTAGPDSGDEEDEDQTQVDNTQPVYNLPPPPENTYPNEPELEKAIHAWSRDHGYEFVRRASKKNARGMLYKRYYHCSKHGQRLNTHKIPEGAPRQRANRKSARTGCPMSIACVAVDPNDPEGEWQIRHRKTHHNHPPMEAIALAGHRRRARMGGVEQAVDGLFAIGSSTAQVLQFLQKTHKDGLYTRTDVANMKLKWKKWGTCADRHSKDRVVRDAAERAGITTTCERCKQRKSWCSAERPTCKNCAESGSECIYNGDGEDEPPFNLMDLSNDGEVQAQDQSAQVDAGASALPQHDVRAAQQPVQQPQEPPQQQQMPPYHQSQQPNQRKAAEQILASLRSFQQEHVTPTRLSLQSSTVEVLANASCGNGESFKSVPVLFDDKDWPTYREAMISAARRENTYEVLLGSKAEPVNPGNSSDIPVEDYNEYIRQQGIYNRRNAVQLSGLWERLSPGFRNRIKGATQAAQAWSTLEELCQPRGSQQAFKLYLDLHSITLASCAGNLHDYISRITSTWERFSQLKLNRSPPPLNRRSDTLPSVRVGSEAVPEEMVCLLFLKGLGEEWGKWVEGLVATNNIGGFGTGDRLGLKELGKRALGYQAMQKLG